MIQYLGTLLDCSIDIDSNDLQPPSEVTLRIFRETDSDPMVTNSIIVVEFELLFHYFALFVSSFFAVARRQKGL